MTLFEKVEKKPARSKGIIVLIVLALGTLGIVAYTFYSSRKLRGMDIAMLFIILSIAAYGTTENIIRGLLTAVAVYLATAVAGSLYTVLTPYSRSILNILSGFGLARPAAGAVDTSALSFSFGFSAIVLWLILQLLFRAALPETHLALLGPVDRAGGAVIFLVIGAVVASLIFNVVGYGVAGRAAHNRAALRPEFNQVIDLVHQSQSFWFAGHPPVMYVFD